IPRIGDVRLAQIELALDPAPRLVFDLAVAEQIVDVLALGCDQLELDLIVQVGELAVLSPLGASMLDMLEPVMMPESNRPHELLGPVALGLELVEALQDCLDRFSARVMLLRSVRVAFSPAGMCKPQRTDDPRQGQALADQRHE